MLFPVFYLIEGKARKTQSDLQVHANQKISSSRFWHQPNNFQMSQRTSQRHLILISEQQHDRAVNMSLYNSPNGSYEGSANKRIKSIL